jgi:hypothetical protein
MFGRKTTGHKGWSCVQNCAAALGLAAFFLFAHSTAGGSATATMSLPGQFGVSPSGASTYTIPIAVPPGTAGIVPSLSLAYSSQGGNGLLGVGWALSGLPAIIHCPQTVAQDGVAGGVKFDASDRFCMGGQRLVVISGVYGADGAEYRTEVDSFAKIISHGAAGNGPAWFEIHTKSGQIMEFGRSMDSQIPAQGKATALAWAMNKVSDSKTNYLTVTWVYDPNNFEFYPGRVDYTGNAAQGVSPYNSVQFVYAPRPDVLPAYQAGSLMQTTVRLTDVQTFSGASLVSDYRIAYQDGATVPLSRVSSIQLCGANSLCLPATSFTTTNDALGTFSLASQTISANFGIPVTSAYTRVDGDFNGDGKSDYALVANNVIYGFLSNGDGTFAQTSQVIGANFGSPPSAEYTLVPGDFNGDGKSDYALVANNVIYGFLSNGDGTFTQAGQVIGVNFSAPASSNYDLVSGDFNGDGRSDFALIADNQIYCFLSNGDGTFYPSVQVLGPSFNSPPRSTYDLVLGDFNGDGRSDYALIGGSQIYGFLSNGDGTFTQTFQAIGPSFGSPPSSAYDLVLGDFNGDGKSDYALIGGNQVYGFLSNGDGTFTQTSQALGPNFGSPPSALYALVRGDFNSDGRSDYALIGGAQVYGLLSRGDGTFAITGATLPANFGSPPTSAYAVVNGDFNGDGKSDLALVAGNTIYTASSTSVGDGMVRSIRDGLGHEITVTYAPLTSSSVYAKDAAARYPQMDLQSPLYVVSRVDSSNGVGGSYSSSYSYAGAKADLSGRGFLGFRQMTTTDLQTGITGTATYRQDFPFVGAVASTTRSLGAQTISQSTNTYQFSNASGTTTISPTSAPYQVSL